MKLNTRQILLSPVALVLFFYIAKASDTISTNKSMRDSETLVSNDKRFILGFFSPENSTNRYVGIMFNTQSPTVAWVANRDKPLQDSSGRVTISEDGNLVVLNAQNKSIWSSNISPAVRNSTAQLSDNGNLVLKDSSNGKVLWESFRDPSDSFLQHMKLGSDKSTNTTNLVKSWISPSDPSVGSFSAGIQPETIPQIFIWKNGKLHCRSGPWNKQIFIGIPDMTSFYLNGFDLVNDNKGTAYLTFLYANQAEMTFFTLNSTGFLQQKYLDPSKNDWEVTWEFPANECDFYGKCGPFGSCDPRSSPICSCLEGFKPKREEEWGKRNWTSGCIRKSMLESERNSSNIEQVKQDWFLKLQSMKVPDSTIWVPFADEDCHKGCLRNFSCIAYSYHTGIGCMHWEGSLLDVQKFSTGGADLFLRLSYTELDQKRDFKVAIAIIVPVGSIIFAIVGYISYKYLAKRRGRKRKRELLLTESLPNFYKESIVTENINQAKFEELLIYNFDILANATEDFHLSSKLGQGGFGPVYKGKLPDGQEIAVKRLSQSSGQGLEEFMNEVVVISKLQHRNLVRLFGCCIERGEKMLVYEYMPKRSLDAYLFGSQQQEEEFLDWSKRVSIIEGIGRGLLYLHRDSRLRIIHRDLKTSNILLDEYLNPKISDFGMARIFPGNQDQANTNRVVGTYGYMAPEYAMEGRFSEKSDVYSFGVLLLEIISGRRNTSFHQDDCALSLLAYAWKCWNENMIVELVDPKITDLHIEKEITRCVHVGLLCVQEYAEDRPNVSTVLSMLTREIDDLSSPKQPAFTTRPSRFMQASSKSQGSVNTVTITIMEGR
ncbi:G-type lectin S-receptor-like serine/threonine-protein kinase At1g11330 [Lycium barbarum]|uniref:G-type lectin S-receptor-like serine/threonine-protein kinase At1g11330 n=1 Tax=Lycium barbarum TaxID=112863 RepID=UPI00293EDD58|nr:G-type lectin S-receptor-like serine/threonine-protein kinase At1g11330 [Lycium barbarum]